MRIGWPQLVMLLVYGCDIGIALARHGQEKSEKYNWLSTLIGCGVSAFILYKGGFWQP